jgi:hypothetical protein
MDSPYGLFVFCNVVSVGIKPVVKSFEALPRVVLADSHIFSYFRRYKDGSIEARVGREVGAKGNYGSQGCRRNRG